ncbi:MAG: hypothetical protein ACP8RL_01565 [cyanobacterium endosymbiont of Rhopalodia inflata]
MIKVGKNYYVIIVDLDKEVSVEIIETKKIKNTRIYKSLGKRGFNQD